MSVVVVFFCDLNHERRPRSRLLSCLIFLSLQADFFRLLVLLKDGGVYSDVDVKLDIDLDSFITPSLGFFAPRDLVAGHGDGNFCLWNGFMGSAPGHPFLVSAAERILNLVLNRGDYYDMEREACRYSSNTGDTEIWKVRALDLLLLTGPCSLGVAVNEALGRNTSVAKFETGWLRTDGMKGDNGDVLILMVCEERFLFLSGLLSERKQSHPVCFIDVSCRRISMTWENSGSQTSTVTYWLLRRTRR